MGGARVWGDLSPPYPGLWVYQGGMGMICRVGR